MCFSLDDQHTQASEIRHEHTECFIVSWSTSFGAGVWGKPWGGVRQDKSRKVLGGRMGRKSRNNNVHYKGAHKAATLLNAVIRWELCELHTLRVNAP
jgi:hypothetical protein